MKKKQESDISRRFFLKTTAALTVASGTGVLSGTAHAGQPGQLATLIDLSLCDGCTDRGTPECISACRTANKGKIPEVVENIPEPWPQKTIEDWSKKQDETDRLTPYNYLFVQTVGVESDGEVRTIHIPRRCMHCDNPACATICPFAANHKMKNGAVVIDSELCLGGAKCRTVCPWDIPQRQSGVGLYLKILPGLMGNGVMYKCDLCHESLEAGQQPACMGACPRNAMTIGPRKELYALAEERAKRMNGFIYGKKENGGTATLYVSPVSFERIDEAIEKSPGRPDMKPGVARRMEESDNLGRAVLAAPVIGMAAGAAGAFRWFCDRKKGIKGGTGNE
jgi:formate dehydrogenase iron-sulfur subunit